MKSFPPESAAAKAGFTGVIASMQKPKAGAFVTGATPRGQLNKLGSAILDASELRQWQLHLYCRPGKHYFFFIRKGKHFMLSSRFPMERFKETNIKMNYVDVPERGWKIDPPMVDRDLEWRLLVEQTEGGECSFDKNRSVFRTFKLDTPQYIEKMFENDLRLTKIPQRVKDKD